MNTFRFAMKTLAVVIFTLAFVSLAQAQATRTWVSGVGDDANPCSRTAPCKTFAGAISKTAACGEIDALDPGGFGAVTITKSITIDGTGTLAGILASGTNGVIINALDTDVITLRGLSINGACTGLNGIRVLQAKTVNVEDCVIFRFTTHGIDVAETNNVQVNIRNSSVRDNAGDGLSITTGATDIASFEGGALFNENNGSMQVSRCSFIGDAAGSAGGAVFNAGSGAVVSNSSFTGNGNGVHAKANSRVTANHSTFSGNGIGLNADAATQPNFGVINAQNNQITLNTNHGVQANGAAGFVRISNNQIANNANNGVIEVGGGSVETFQNNSINGNGTDGCPGCANLLPG